MRHSSEPVKRAVRTWGVRCVGSGAQEVFTREDVERLVRREAEAAYREGDTAGYGRGLGEGVQKGLQEEQHRLAGRVQELARLVEGILSEREALFRAAEAEVIDLALAVAAKIVRREVNERSPAATLAAEAIRRAIDHRLIRVRVHPDDYERLMGEKDRLAEMVKGIERFEIVAEKSVVPGGCLVETNAGRIDARLDRQLEEIRRALTED